MDCNRTGGKKAGRVIQFNLEEEESMKGKTSLLKQHDKNNKYVVFF